MNLKNKKLTCEFSNSLNVEAVRFVNDHADMAKIFIEAISIDAGSTVNNEREESFLEESAP